MNSGPKPKQVVTGNLELFMAVSAMASAMIGDLLSRQPYANKSASTLSFGRPDDGSPHRAVGLAHERLEWPYLPKSWAKSLLHRCGTPTQATRSGRAAILNRRETRTLQDGHATNSIVRRLVFTASMRSGTSGSERLMIHRFFPYRFSHILGAAAGDRMYLALRGHV